MLSFCWSFLTITRVSDEFLLFQVKFFNLFWWSQENAADELAENIVKFVSSLPKSARRVEEEPIPEHVQKMLDEAKDSHHHHHGHGGHGNHDGHTHAHTHGAGYMDAYGLGHGWGSWIFFLSSGQTIFVKTNVWFQVLTLPFSANSGLCTIVIPIPPPWCTRSFQPLAGVCNYKALLVFT